MTSKFYLPGLLMFQTGFAHHSQSIFGMWRFRIAALSWTFTFLDFGLTEMCPFPQYIFAVCIPFEWSPNGVNANRFKTFTDRQSLHIVDSTTFNWSLGLAHGGYILAILHKLHIPEMEIFSCIIIFAFDGNNEKGDCLAFSAVIFLPKIRVSQISQKVRGEQ